MNLPHVYLAFMIIRKSVKPFITLPILLPTTLNELDATYLFLQMRKCDSVIHGVVQILN